MECIWWAACKRAIRMTQRIEMPINKANPFVFLSEPIKSALCAMGPRPTLIPQSGPESARKTAVVIIININQMRWILCADMANIRWLTRPFVSAANAYLCPLYCSFICDSFSFCWRAASHNPSVGLLLLSLTIIPSGRNRLMAIVLLHSAVKSSLSRIGSGRRIPMHGRMGTRMVRE